MTSAWIAGAWSPGDSERWQATVQSFARARGTKAETAGPMAVAASAAFRGDGVLGAVAGPVYSAAGADRVDPAALAAAFRRSGTAALEHLRGPLAFALWDETEGSGVLGGDPMALSSIFYARVPGALLFAGEVRDLIALLPTRPRPDPTSVAHALAGDFPPPGRTLYDGVTRLMSGECLVLDKHTVDKREFWAPRYEGTAGLGADEMSERVRDQLDVAVQRAAGDARRVGVLLSGGLDSSMVAASAARSGLSVSGYSAVFPEQPELDESEYVRSLAERWDIGRNDRPFRAEGAFETALEYLREWELPVLGPGYLLERALVADMRSDGVHAVLDGQGGDELFATAFLLPSSMVRRGRFIRAFQLLRRTPATADVSSPRVLARAYVRGVLKPAVPTAIIAARRRDRAVNTPEWLSPSATAALRAHADDLAWRRTGDGPLWWRWLSDLVVRLPAACGRSDYIRHRSASGGLAPGSPLLDFDLAQLVLRAHPERGFDRVLDRPVAREAMRGVLPEPVRTRRSKSDLSAFYNELLVGPDFAHTRRVLGNPDAAIYEYLDRDKVKPLLDGPVGAGDVATFMWRSGLDTAAAVECWLRRQEDPSSTDDLLAREPQPTPS